MVIAARGASRRVGTESSTGARRRSTALEGAAEHERVWRSMRRRNHRRHSGGQVVAIANPYCTLGYPANPMSRPTLTQDFSGSIHEVNFTLFHFFGSWATGSARVNLHPELYWVPYPADMP
jgi:hypothetical protein